MRRFCIFSILSAGPYGHGEYERISKTIYICNNLFRLSSSTTLHSYTTHLYVYLLLSYFFHNGKNSKSFFALALNSILIHVRWVMSQKKICRFQGFDSTKKEWRHKPNVGSEYLLVKAQPAWGLDVLTRTHNLEIAEIRRQLKSLTRYRLCQPGSWFYYVARSKNKAYILGQYQKWAG